MYCATWGAALMQLMYDFMATRVAIYGVPKFPVPQMRYVHVALAVANNVTHDTYLLEEVIDEACDGMFLKYINNDHNAPIERPDHPERTEIGEFLAFAQHVQYMKTQKMAFVSDIQGSYSLTKSVVPGLILLFPGGRTLLSDPQIITSPYLSTYLLLPSESHKLFTAKSQHPVYLLMEILHQHLSNLERTISATSTANFMVSHKISQLPMFKLPCLVLHLKG
jgi:hypothetical protein